MYVTQGQYDVVVTMEAPPAEAALKGVAAVSMRGDTRWETMSAVTVHRFRELLQSSAVRPS